MTGPLALFYVAGALALAGAVGAVTRRDPAAAIGWYVAALAGAATIAVLVQAPLPAIVLGLASAWGLALLALAARDPEPDDGAAAAGRPRGRAPTIAAGIGLALLAWVFVGTWGRQQAFPGHDLAPGASFGGVRELASAAAGELAVLWIAAPLLILAAVLAASTLLGAGDEG